MKTFLRLTFLVSCAALGVGVAICLASTLTDAPRNVAVSSAAPVEPKPAEHGESAEPTKRPSQRSRPNRERPELQQPTDYVGQVYHALPQLSEPPSPRPAPTVTMRLVDPEPVAPLPAITQRVNVVQSPPVASAAVRAPIRVAAAPVTDYPGMKGAMDDLPGPFKSLVEDGTFGGLFNQPEIQQYINSPNGQNLLKAQIRQQLQARGETVDDKTIDQHLPTVMKMFSGAFGAGPQLGGAPPVPAGATPPAPRPEGELPVGKEQTTTTNPPAEPTPSPVEEQMTTEHIRTSEGDDRLTINIPSMDLRDVLDHLAAEGGLNILATPSVQGRVAMTLREVSVDQALDAILKSSGFISKREGKFVYVGTPQEFETMKTSLDSIGTRVYRPNYVTAKELQTLVSPLLSQGVGKSSITTPPEMGIATNSASAGGDNFASGEALLVQDYEAVLCQVDQVVKEIDRRPLQVAIEAMILSVNLSDANKFGVDLQFLRNQPNLRFGTGTPRTDPLSGAGTVNPATGGIINEFTFPAPGGLKFAFMDQSLGAFITALETIGDTNVIATPRLLCLNKQRAEILIGSQIGYTTTTVTQTFSTQTVQFLEVGTQLRLRPYISTDGTIRMEIHPELSNAGTSTNGVPSKNVTQVTTNIMCPDGCTVVIGGLMQETLQTNTNQVPVLGSLPVVGPLFRTRNDSIVRQEVLVLITPRIVYEPEFNQESAKEMSDSYRRQAVKEDYMSLLSRTELSKKYLRKAEEALAAGDFEHARKFSQLAVFFDPNNSAAIDIRSRLDEDGMVGPGPAVAPAKELPPGGAEPLPAPAPRQAIDGEAIAPWLLDDLQGQMPLPAGPTVPRDRGVPGYSRKIIKPGVFDDERH
jgi:type IV pilus assembly protein PilQ